MEGVLEDVVECSDGDGRFGGWVKVERFKVGWLNTDEAIVFHNYIILSKVTYSTASLPSLPNTASLPLREICNGTSIQ